MLTSGCPSDFHHAQTTALHAHIQWSTACTHLVVHRMHTSSGPPDAAHPVVHRMRHIRWTTSGTFPDAWGCPLVGNQWTTGCEGRLCIIVYGKRENARRDKCVAVCVICFIFLAAPFYTFQTFPGKAQLFSRCFFPFVLSAVIDMSDPWMYPEHRKVRYVFCIGLLYLFIYY